MKNLKKVIPGILRKRAALSIAGALIVAGGLYTSQSQAATASAQIIGIAGKCLNNASNQAQLTTCTTSSSQKWSYKDNGTIVNNNGLCLNATGTVAASLVSVAACNGSRAQNWNVNNANTTIINRQSGLCLDDKNSITTNGNPVQVAACNNSAAQVWVPQGAVTPPPVSKLTFAPPSQAAPITVNVPVTGLSQTFSSTQDVILKLPSAAVTGQINTNGGRNIRVIGGKIGGSATYNGTYGIVARNLHGSLFVEGVDIDFSQLTDKDVIVATGNSPKGVNRAGWTYPSVYIQNSRLMGSKWSGGGFHPDLYQKQGPQSALYMDKVTGEASYQALFLAAQSVSSGPAPTEQYTEGMDYTEIRRTNLRHRADHTVGMLATFAWDAGSNPGYSGEDPWPIALSELWVEGIPGHTLASNLVWPRTNTIAGENGQDPHLTVTADGLNGTWTPASLISGTARKGAPPTGDFVPAGQAGIGYVSPGYL